MPEKIKTAPNDSQIHTRRLRYARSAPSTAFVSLTPVKVRMLHYLAELRFLSLPQLARLCCPAERQDLSEKSARRHLRSLFDAGLVDVLPVSRAALAPPDAGNDASLLQGSAPNVYMPTAAALKALCRVGLVCEEMRRPVPAYGPRNSLFLAHELAVRDVRVWLEEVARAGGYELESWRDGEAAAINFDRSGTRQMIRPDARFVLRLGQVVLVGLVEVDRGTERGNRHWREKLSAYGALYARGGLQAATGYVNARVLVIAPDSHRRDRLAERIEQADFALAERFWLAEQSVLAHADLCVPFWRLPRDRTPRPLVSC